MNGQKWSNLVKAISNLYDGTFLNNRALLEKVKVTVIVYTESANMLINTETPVQSHVNKLSFKSGGTDFNPPLSMAYDNMIQNTKEFPKHRMYFLTDGQAPYPTQAIQKFKANQSLMDKTIFKFVLFGNDKSPTLDLMKNSLGGEISNAVTYEELFESFLEIVNSI